MQNNESIRLLHECDSGIKMGIESISQVMDSVSSERMKGMLEQSLDEHRELSRKIENKLADMGADGKNPNPIAQGMSRIKTGMKLTMDKCDATVAGLMTDGCHMGIKSISKCINENSGADASSRELAQRLVTIEEKLARNMRDYL